MDVVNILIIDDIKDDAAFLEKTLKSKEYNVWVASTFNEAMQLVKDISFTLGCALMKSTSSLTEAKSRGTWFFSASAKA